MPNPIGTITLWAGAIVAIPPNWQLCDGTNGTPNLRSRFVIGAGPAIPVDETGGAINHSHDFDANLHSHAFESNGHDHNMQQAIAVAGSGPMLAWDGDGAVDETDTENATGDTDESEVSGTTDLAGERPPYWALAYIQRMA